MDELIGTLSSFYIIINNLCIELVEAVGNSKYIIELELGSFITDSLLFLIIIQKLILTLF